MKKEKNNIISMFGDEKTSGTSDVKYSKLMNDFFAHFENDFAEGWTLDEVIEFATVAWNFGNLKAIMPKEEFNAVINNDLEQDPNKELLQKMIARKTSKFKKYNRFFVDFKLTINEDDSPILTVTTQSEEDFLTNMMDDVSQFTPEDMEEDYIDRQAIIIKPKQPFLDWVNNVTSLSPDDPITEVREANVYLVDEGIDDLEKWLRKKFDKFFIMELEDWLPSKKEWPKKRNYKMFQEWFQVDISSMIYDLEERPIIKG